MNLEFFCNFSRNEKTTKFKYFSRLGKKINADITMFPAGYYIIFIHITLLLKININLSVLCFTRYSVKFILQLYYYIPYGANYNYLFTIIHQILSLFAVFPFSSFLVLLALPFTLSNNFLCTG